MTMTTLSSKNQITLPANVREFLHAKPGDKIIINVEGMHAVLRVLPVRKNKDVSRLSGILKPYYKGPKIDIDKAIGEYLVAQDEKTKSKPAPFRRGRA
jgi:AbrB family looped-hinge helix DNA binding protein